jgi:LmbE family N-acetylglucosaminyl deacetylase
MGSRGTSEERDKEAEEAASSVGARFRENLGLPDCGVIDSVKNRKQIARVIRRHRPKLVLAPYWKDRPRPCSDRPSHSEFGRALHAEKVERLESTTQAFGLPVLPFAPFHPAQHGRRHLRRIRLRPGA